MRLFLCQVSVYFKSYFSTANMLILNCISLFIAIIYVCQETNSVKLTPDEFELEEAPFGQSLTNDEFEAQPAYSNADEPDCSKVIQSSADIVRAPSCEISRAQIQSHSRRFVSLLLRLSGLKDKNISELDKSTILKGTIHVSISAEKLDLLQKFSRNERNDLQLGDLDTIVSEMVYRSAFQDSAEMIRNWNLWEILPQISLYQFILVATISTAVYLYYWFGLTNAIVFLFIFLTFLDALNLYSKEIKKMEVKHYLEMRRRNVINAGCDDPSKRGFFDYIFNYFLEDQCILAELEIPEEQISFVQCLVNTYLLTFLEIPLGSLGTALGHLTYNVSGRFGYMQYILVPVILVLAFISLIFVAYAFIGSSLSISSIFGTFTAHAPRQLRREEYLNLTAGTTQLAVPPVINVVINQGRRKLSLQKIEKADGNKINLSSRSQSEYYLKDIPEVKKTAECIPKISNDHENSVSAVSNFKLNLEKSPSCTVSTLEPLLSQMNLEDSPSDFIEQKVSKNLPEECTSSHRSSSPKKFTEGAENSEFTPDEFPSNDQKSGYTAVLPVSHSLTVLQIVPTDDDNYVNSEDKSDDSSSDNSDDFFEVQNISIVKESNNSSDSFSRSAQEMGR